MDQMDALIKEHTGLAHSLAQQVWRNAPHALDLDDLKGTAVLGLVAAARRWHPYCREKGYRPDAWEYFKPFIVRRIHGALIDEVRKLDFASRALRARARALQEAGQERGLSETELAERSGLTVKEVRATVRGLALRPVSLDAEELDPCSAEDVESAAFSRYLMAAFVDAVRLLEEDQRVVIVLHYYKGLQLQAVAKVMGITESRASQLHATGVLTVHEILADAARNGL